MGAFLPILVGLLFFGAMFWARGRDPFQRVWFKVKVPGWGKVECIAVLPKTAAKPLPVVVYLHGAGGSLLGSGNELRQMAEMGLAAVGMEYDQSTVHGPQATVGGPQSKVSGPESKVSGPEAAAEVGDVFEAQFTALLEYLQRQRWADTNRVAWVGFSLGAQHLLSYWLKHPERRPELLVRLAGGWVEDLRFTNYGLRGSADISVRAFTSRGLADKNVRAPSVLLLHGENDEVFPSEEVRRVAACLETNGMPVELNVLPGEGHGLGADRLLVFRVIGEQCLTRLKGADALAHYRSILSWQAEARPLWVFWMPALAWVGTWFWVRRRGRDTDCTDYHEAAGPISADSCNPCLGVRTSSRRLDLRWRDVALRWLAGVLAVAALGQTALHLVPPRLATSERTLSIARKHLVQAKELGDFEFLAANPVWRGKPLKTLLEHAELAHYNRELINWKLEDAGLPAVCACGGD